MTFAALFNDASRDPFLVNGGYEAFLTPFMVEDNNNAAPLVRAMGVAEHPATDGRMYAFEGELIGTQSYLIELADKSFHLTPRMTVPDVGHVHGLLAANSQLLVVGPFEENAINTLTVRTRYLVPLPNKYAALFLAHEGGITPRYYFDMILPLIEADGMSVNCEPLTRFCLAAITIQADAESPVVIDAPRPLGRHVPLLEQAAQILSTHLMGLRHMAAPEVNLQPLINTLSLARSNDSKSKQTLASTESSRTTPLSAPDYVNEMGHAQTDALESGSVGNVFLFTDSDVESAQGVNRQIDFIQQGGATPSYTDVQTLLKTKINLPGPNASVRCVLWMLAVYRMILPKGHRLITFLQQHHNLMNAYDPGWAMYPTYNPQLRGLKGVYHLQWLSLKLTRYFGQLDCNMVEVRAPDPHKIIDHIQEQRHLGTSSTTTGSTISGVTFPSLTSWPPTAVVPTTGASSRITNEGFNEALFGSYKTNALKSKTVHDKVKAGTIPPLPTSTRDGAKPMCLAWHTKGVCNENCPCVYNHVAYSEAEYAPMYLDYLKEEFIDMINKGQWIVLLYSAIRHLPGLRISPPGVIPQWDHRPHWIVDYSWWDVNDDTLPLAAMESMQFGHALDHILREILLANPAFGPVHLLKLDISDSFYRIALDIDDIPKLGVAFPTADNADPLVALPLVLPMGWKNSPPIFSTATETIADIVNARITAFAPHLPHHLNDMAELILSLPLALGGSTIAPLLVTHDPSLPSLSTSLAYVDVYVDNFVGAAQCSPAGSQDLDNRRCVRRLLLQAVDDVFRPLSHGDGPDRREPVSMKKLAAGDCSWGTVKQVLGWVIDTVDMTIALPPHRATRLLEILDSFPPSQRWTSTKRWHGALGELRSMALALPGARHIFSSMQNALSTQSKNRLALGNGVHDALADIQWMHSNISTRPTRIVELVPLPPVWGTMMLRGRGPGGSGSITSSDLELAGELLHLDALAHAFDVRECTILSQGDNLSTTFWEQNGSTSTASAPAYLLWLFGIHQQHHRYVPRFDYISGASNHIADSLSHDFHLPWSALLTSLSSYLPQSVGCQIWTPSPPIVSAVTSALLRLPSSRESLLGEPLAMPLPGPTRGNPVKSRSAEDYVQHVAQTFLNMGAKDPRLNSASKIDFRIQCILPLATSTFQAASDMIILAFFFLLRPGEYTDNDGDPFRLADVQLFIGDTRLPQLMAPASELCLARFALLTFTTQKNGVRGEVIGLACSVQAIIRQVIYLRSHSATLSTPLARVFNTPDKVTASYLTVRIHDAVAACGPLLGFLPTKVLTRCLRAAGATALLLARVDPDVIHLIGRWRLDEMLRYLHVQAYPLMHDYSQRMLSSGSYTLIPNNLVPQR
ncbi:hypothetical protein ACHAXA_009089 [Cyclostephanos tholiformis]|uniref:Reverse transcriptase domain-containing protein n=1 Tax=Cyclostephanos tholiformis TaxID=382380 RepID=A0ABD3SR27_9STRA